MAEGLPWKTPEKFVREASEVRWANDILKSPPIEEHLIDLFCVESEWRDNAEIELNAVVGSVHPDYQGRSWLWFLEHGKRIRGNLSLMFHNPGYYFSPEKKLPSMSYLQIDGEYYVYSDGNHRTCIAKFLFALLGQKAFLTGVEIHRKILNFRVYHAWKKLNGNDGRVTIERRKVAREDDSGWMREFYDLRFTVFKGKRCYRNLSSKELIELSQEKEKCFLYKAITTITKLLKKTK